MMRIALDTMGGDHAPEQTVKGAVEYVRRYPKDQLTVTLVGSEPILREEIAKYSIDPDRIDIVHTSEVVEMHDRPARILKTKRDSSLVKAVELLQAGKVDAAVSAGNTGAFLSASLFLLCDAGANVDVRARDLVQFALMARAYSIHIFNHPKPRVGLLNIGTEVGKGNDLTVRAYDLLAEHIDNFIGNVEARDLFAGVADVVVCDGFVGNIVIKIVEGMVLHVSGWARKKVKRYPLSQLVLPLMRPALRDLVQELDYEEHGGSPLLGLNGVVVVAHGSSSARAIMNALNTAHRSVSENLITSIQQGIEAHLDIFEERNGVAAKQNS
jgi:glycerol-3-phosphate acyltransferase PlsX